VVATSAGTLIHASHFGGGGLNGWAQRNGTYCTGRNVGRSDRLMLLGAPAKCRVHKRFRLSASWPCEDPSTPLSMFKSIKLVDAFPRRVSRHTSIHLHHLTTPPHRVCRRRIKMTATASEPTSAPTQNGNSASAKRHEEYQYLDLVKEILEDGEHRPDRSASTLDPVHAHNFTVH
jgi:hypothetical protein